MISVKPQERLVTFPTVKNPTNFFSSEPFRKCLAKNYPLAWEKSQIVITSKLIVSIGHGRVQRALLTHNSSDQNH